MYTDQDSWDTEKQNKTKQKKTLLYFQRNRIVSAIHEHTNTHRKPFSLPVSLKHLNNSDRFQKTYLFIYLFLLSHFISFHFISFQYSFTMQPLQPTMNLSINELTFPLGNRKQIAAVLYCLCVPMSQFSPTANLECFLLLQRAQLTAKEQFHCLKTVIYLHSLL